MAENTLATRQDDGAAIVEQVVVQGDLAKLNAQQRVTYYRQVCESLGLNPYTRPFDYIVLNGKLTLYAKRDATDQLRKLHRVSVAITGRDHMDDLYAVTARATMPDGRTDESIGAVAISSLKGDARANAVMKAETKAKRRVTLSIVGLGWLDETEIETIPDAKPVDVDADTGEIINTPSAPVADANVGANGDNAARPSAWSRSEQNRFRELVTFSPAMSGMGISKDELTRLVPEVAAPKSFGAYAVLGTVDEAVQAIKGRLAEALSAGADEETE